MADMFRNTHLVGLFVVVYTWANVGVRRARRPVASYLIYKTAKYI